MRKHFCFLSIVLAGLLSIFATSCYQGMDTIVDTMTDEMMTDDMMTDEMMTDPSSTGPVTHQNYTYHGTLDHEGIISDVAFGPDGALASLGDDSVKVWRILPTEQLIESYAFSISDPFEIVRVLPTPIVAVVGTTDNIEISSIGTADVSLSVPHKHTSPVRAFAFSEDRFATGSSDETVHVWEVQQQVGAEDPVYTHKHTLEHDGQVWAVAFSPDGQTLASGGGFEGIYLWDTDTGQSKGAPLIANTAQVEGLAFSADGQTLAVATGLNTGEVIHLWDLGTNQLTETLMDPFMGPLSTETTLVLGSGFSIRKVAISPDGQIIAGGAFDPSGGLGVYLWKRK